MMTRICRIGRKQSEAGKAGISPGTSTARFLSNRLGYGVDITELATYAYNAAANKVPERGRPRPLTSFGGWPRLTPAGAWRRIHGCVGLAFVPAKASLEPRGPPVN